MKEEKQAKEEEVESIRDGLSDTMAEKISRSFREKQESDNLIANMVR